MTDVLEDLVASIFRIGKGETSVTNYESALHIVIEEMRESVSLRMWQQELIIRILYAECHSLSVYVPLLS